MGVLDWLIRKLCDYSGEGYGNCYMAVLIYIRDGGHLIVTKSAGHPLIPHVAWTDQLPPTLVRHFIPVNRKKGWRAIVYSPCFRGKWQSKVISGRRAIDGSTIDSRISNGRRAIDKTED